VESKKGMIHRVKYWQISVAILAALFTSIVLADDFKTTDAKEYKNAKISRVEPDGIVITFSGGIVKLPFVELPRDVQKKYGYDSQVAATYTAEENQKQTALAQQRKADEQRRFEERQTYWNEQAQIKSQQQAEIQGRREEAAQEAAKQQRQAETQRGLASTPPYLRRGYRSTLTNFCRITLLTWEPGVSVLDAASVTAEKFSLITLKSTSTESRIPSLPASCLHRKIEKSSLTISAKPVGVGDASQQWTRPGERSLLPMRTSMTENVSLCERKKS
jgi:hypothetical protein